MKSLESIRFNLVCQRRKAIISQPPAYIYKSDCIYVPMSLFHARTARPISTKFCTDLPTNSEKVLKTSVTHQLYPWTQGYPTLQNQNGSLEKKLCFTKNVQMGDVCSSNFSRAAPGPGWLVFYIYRRSDCLYWCTYMYPFHAQTARPISTKFCTDLPANSGKVLNTSVTPPTWPPGPQGTPNSKTWSLEKKLCFTQNVQMGDVSSSNFSRAAPGPGWLV